jgi:hypothetical protein
MRSSVNFLNKMFPRKKIEMSTAGLRNMLRQRRMASNTVEEAATRPTKDDLGEAEKRPTKDDLSTYQEAASCPDVEPTATSVLEGKQTRKLSALTPGLCQVM